MDADEKEDEEDTEMEEAEEEEEGDGEEDFDDDELDDDEDGGDSEVDADIFDDSDDDSASTSFSAATTRPYNCSTCGGNHPCHKCPLKALQVQFEEDTASLFKSNKIPGSITLEASIDCKPFTIKAKLTHSRFTDLCTDLDAHVLESIKFHVASSVKKTSIRRSAAEAELAAKMQAMEAKNQKKGFFRFLRRKKGKAAAAKVAAPDRKSVV